MTRTLFTDADNTLWETDGVYANAQLALLRAVEEFGATRVGAETDRLAFVRAVDQRISHEHPDGQRYPPAVLAKALLLALSGMTAGDAAARAQRDVDLSPQLDAAARLFTRDITAAPALRAGVAETLRALHAADVPVVVITETDEARCERLLAVHSLHAYVVGVTCGKKNPDLYRRLRPPGERPIMVGDQLDRDIAYAQEAGYETVLYPGGYRPYWADAVRVEPDHRIARYDELLPLFAHG